METYDVAVVGGGLSGMIVANMSAEVGLKTLVIEKGPQAPGMNSARISTGMLSLAGMPLDSPAEKIEEAMTKKTDGEIDPRLAKSIGAAAPRAWDWLVAHGLQFIRQPTGGARVAPVGWNVKTKIQPNRGTELWMRGLYSTYKKSGGALMLGSRAKKLVKTKEGWKLTVATKSGTKTVEAKMVALCDGGFQANPKLLDKYVAPHASRCLLRAMPSGTGDGLEMAIANGAGTAGFGRFYGHVTSRDAFKKDLWPYPWLDAPALRSLMIDRNGNVLREKTDDGIKLANLLAHTNDPANWFAVMSDSDWKKFGSAATQGTGGTGPGAIPSAYPYLEDMGGTVHRADSLEGLAKKAGIKAAPLKKHYAEYQANDPEVDRSPATYVAVPVISGITFTMGGVAVDDRGRVVDKKGKPIAGLYAAGSTCGGIHGSPVTSGYLGGLAVSISTAYAVGTDLKGDA